MGWDVGMMRLDADGQVGRIDPGDRAGWLRQTRHR